MEDVSSLTGESNFQRPPRNIIVNEITFNGKEGKFYLLDVVNRKKGEKTEKTVLGSSIRVIFLNHRRRLQWYNSSEERFYTSTEHNSKEDTVYLFGANIQGKANELREKYKDLEVQHLIYSYLLRDGHKAELVKIVVRGASLGSQNTPEGVLKLYDYLGSFGKKHSYQFVTIMEAISEPGKLGPYMVTSFIREIPVHDERMPTIIEKIKEIAETTKQQDNFYNKNDVNAIKKSEELPVVEYPEEEISPDDIPF